MSKRKTTKGNQEKTRDLNNVVEEKRKIFPLALALFAAAFILHAIFNTLVKEYPTVVIDEGLYTNIARSLAWEGKLAFRGQPVNYPYLLYPFLLVPVYWLNAHLGGDIFRAVQIFNTLLMTTSVFPACYFAKDFTKDNRKALFAALIVALMPDMIMGGYEMTECLIWPLSFWMVFFCYRYYSTDQLKYGMLTALFSGFMFATKPGAIAAGAVMLLFHLVKSIKEDRKSIKTSALSLLLLLASVAAVYVIFLLLFDKPDSLLGLYTKQTEEWRSGDTWVAIEAVFLMIFLFIFACGGIFGIFPVAALGDYEKTKRRFILAFLFGVLTAIIGTAIFVVPYKWTGKLGELPLHLRYCAMFVPIMYVFTVDRNLESSKNRRVMISLAVLIVLSVFPGARAGFVKGETGIIDSVVLAAFNRVRNLDGNITGWILTVFMIGFCILLIYKLSGLSKTSGRKMKKENQQQQRKLCMIGTAGFMLFILYNAVCAHFGAHVYIDPTISKDALEVEQMISGQECLGITQRYYDDIYTYWLESRLNRPMQQVTSDQIFIRMEETDGIYSPFTPIEQSPNVNNHKTPETDTFVLGMTIAEHMELNRSAMVEKTENGHFSVVRIDPAERWVDTMMYGLDDDALYPGTSAYIHIFDENRNNEGQVTIMFTAYGNGTLVVDGVTVETDDRKKTYEVTVPYKKVIPIRAEDGTVQILGYSTGTR